MPACSHGRSSFRCLHLCELCDLLYCQTWNLTKYIFVFGVLGFAILAGGVVGTSVHLKQLVDYWPYYQKQHYTNVAPDEPAAAHSDASVLVFMEGARPDATRATSYKRNKVLYCAAPIDVEDSEDATQTTNIQYWAIGQDCCKNGFTCDDATNSKARSGLVKNKMEGADLIGQGILSNDDMNYYDKAVLMAVTKFDLTSPKERLYVHFVEDVEKARQAHWSQAWGVWWKLQLLWFVVWMVAGTFYVIVGAGDLSRDANDMKDAYTTALHTINHYV